MFLSSTSKGNAMPRNKSNRPAAQLSKAPKSASTGDLAVDRALMSLAEVLREIAETASRSGKEEK